MTVLISPSRWKKVNCEMFCNQTCSDYIFICILFHKLLSRLKKTDKTRYTLGHGLRLLPRESLTQTQTVQNYLRCTTHQSFELSVFFKFSIGLSWRILTKRKKINFFFLLPKPIWLLKDKLHFSFWCRTPNWLWKEKVSLTITPWLTDFIKNAYFYIHLKIIQLNIKLNRKREKVIDFDEFFFGLGLFGKSWSLHSWSILKKI